MKWSVMKPMCSLAIKDNQRSSRARADKVVDVDGKAKLVEARWGRKDHLSLG
jgi:hypothetical protein